MDRNGSKPAQAVAGQGLSMGDGASRASELPCYVRESPTVAPAVQIRVVAASMLHDFAGLLRAPTAPYAEPRLPQGARELASVFAGSARGSLPDDEAPRHGAGLAAGAAGH